MVEKVFRYIQKYRMIEKDGTIIAGVSGGADSVCLLFMLLRIREKIPFHLAVVHVNHGAREDAGEDAAYVRDLCAQFELPFYLTEANMEAYAKEHALSMEEAGRSIRYQAFADALMKECSMHQDEDLTREKVLKKGKIAVAHNSNDRAETMLFHLFRGTGLSGVGGIRPVSGNVVRPLLCLEREEIESWLSENQISFRTDSTNAQDVYTRNRIRHHILPFAREQICQRAVGHMNQAADDLQAAEDFILKEVLKAKERCIQTAKEKTVPLGKNQEQEIQIEISALLKEEEYLQGRVLLSCIEDLVPGRKDITSVHVSNIKQLLTKEGSKELHLPYDLIVYKKYQELILKKKDSASNPEKNGISDDLKEYDVSISGRMEIPGLGIVEISAFPFEKTEIIPRKTYTKWFDYDKITASACFRVRAVGDYLTINSRLDHKSLQDYFVNEKIPKKDRDSFYVLADGAHIMWVPGYRISEYYKVSECTKTVLEVNVIQDTEEERSHGNG